MVVLFTQSNLENNLLYKLFFLLHFLTVTVLYRKKIKKNVFYFLVISYTNKTKSNKTDKFFFSKPQKTIKNSI